MRDNNYKKGPVMNGLSRAWNRHGFCCSPCVCTSSLSSVVSIGRQVTLQDFAAFIDGLEVAPGLKAQLRTLRPETYTGLAGLLAKK